MNETLERLKRKAQFYTIALLIGLVLLGLAYLEFIYHYSYSKGESVGYVQKLSLKGWVCKTWEGEQLKALSAQPSPSVAEKFYFTVRDDAVADKINASIGERVVLSYSQHPGLPTCFGETDHFIVDVQPAPKD
jgi:proteasome lid subunit RPN8/RPN11